MVEKTIEGLFDPKKISYSTNCTIEDKKIISVLSRVTDMFYLQFGGL